MPIFLTALTIAVLDGLFAIATVWSRLHGAAPRRVMQSVAAGVLGKASFDGGTATALLGTALHFTVALGWTLGYFVVVRRLTAVQRLVGTTRGAMTVGAIYGAFIWLAMAFVVIPLSRATAIPLDNWRFWANFVWHIVGLGPVIVFLIESKVRVRTPAVAAA